MDAEAVRGFGAVAVASLQGAAEMNTQSKASCACREFMRGSGGIAEIPSLWQRSPEIRPAVRFDDAAVSALRTGAHRCTRPNRLNYRQRLKNPAKSVEEYLAALEKLGFAATVAALWPFAALLNS